MPADVMIGLRMKAKCDRYTSAIPSRRKSLSDMIQIGPLGSGQVLMDYRALSWSFFIIRVNTWPR